jgi:hypothetical protein
MPRITTKKHSSIVAQNMPRITTKKHLQLIHLARCRESTERIGEMAAIGRGEMAGGRERRDGRWQGEAI